MTGFSIIGLASPIAAVPAYLAGRIDKGALGLSLITSGQLMTQMSDQTSATGYVSRAANRFAGTLGTFVALTGYALVLKKN